MAEWKTIKSESIETGRNNFIEVSLKEAPETKNIFISISKGWINNEGMKRYKSNILITKEKVNELLEAIEKISS